MSTAKRQNIALQKLSNLLSQFLMQFLRWHGQKSIEVIVRYFGFLGSLDSGLLEAIIATYGQCQPDSCFAIQICHNKTEQIWHRQSFWHGESSGFTSFKGKTVFESFLDFVRHTDWEWFIKSLKLGGTGLDGNKLKCTIGTHGHWKNQNPGGRFGATS